MGDADRRDSDQASGRDNREYCSPDSGADHGEIIYLAATALPPFTSTRIRHLWFISRAGVGDADHRPALPVSTPEDVNPADH
jgi:hypothetical protein